MTSDPIYAIAIDSSGNKWFGTIGGVGRLGTGLPPGAPSPQPLDVSHYPSTVTPPTVTPPTVIPGLCQANFTAEPTTGVGNTVVNFTDKSTGNIIAWAWDFNNDGVIDSTIENPSHTFTTNGNYTITLTITTSNCQDKLIKQDYISITGCST